MKVVFAANIGLGLYKFRKELIKTLVDSGHDVYVILPNDQYSVYLEKLGCKVVHINIDRRGINPVKDFNTFISYINLFKKIKPDYVFTYTIKPNIYGGLAASLTKTPYSATITGLGTAMESTSYLSKVLQKLYAISLKNANSVFFQNETNAKHFLDNKLYDGSVKLVPGSGVNISEYNLIQYPKESENIKFLFVGRLMKAKGIEELLSVSLEIYKTNPTVEFHIVGFADDDYDHGVDSEYPNVIFHGEQEDVKPYIERSHALVLPSHHEGLANVLLEAASIGRPVIASNIPGCIETFEDRKSGMAFEVKNEQALFETLIEFIELPHQVKREMGLKGRAKIEKEFDRNIVIEKYVNQIEEAVY